MESASLESKKRQGSYRVAFPVALQKKCSIKSGLLWGFPEEHLDVTAAKESPLLLRRSLAEGSVKAGIRLRLAASVKCVWREGSLRR